MRTRQVVAPLAVLAPEIGKVADRGTGMPTTYGAVDRTTGALALRHHGRVCP